MRTTVWFEMGFFCNFTQGCYYILNHICCFHPPIVHIFPYIDVSLLCVKKLLDFKTLSSTWVTFFFSEMVVTDL